MATVTHEITTADTTNAGPYASGSFSPAVGDLIVVLVHFSGSTDLSPTCSASANGVSTFTLAGSVPTNDALFTAAIFVADALTTGTASMTVSVDTPADAANGCDITVLTVGGMTNTGTAAVRQTAESTAAAGATPAVTFSAACLTGSVVVGIHGNKTNPAGVTPPTGWTEAADTGHATPTTGTETIYRESGFTGTTVTWGSTSPSLSGTLAVELDPGGGGGGSPGVGGGTGSWAFAGGGSGTTTKSGSGSGAWSYAGTGSGTATKTGSGGGAWSYAGTGTGAAPKSGSGAGGWSFSGAGSGTAAPSGAGAGSWSFTGSGSGTAPPVGGSAGGGSGAWAFTGAGSGTTGKTGSGSGAWGFTGAGDGTAPAVGASSGTGTGTWSYVGTGSGTAPSGAPGTGTGTGTWAYAGVGSGSAPAVSAWLFRTPTVQRGTLTADPLPRQHALMRHYRGPRQGVAVLVTGTSIVEKQVPTAAEVNAADHVFLGGHDHTITDTALADLLEQAGYTLEPI